MTLGYDVSKPAERGQVVLGLGVGPALAVAFMRQGRPLLVATGTKEARLPLVISELQLARLLFLWDQGRID